MTINRREFILAAGAASLGFAGMQRLVMGGATTSRTGFGPLVPDPDGWLDLPKGFSYKVIAKVGDRMADGLLVPGLADGMAAFEGPEGKTILVVNHELSPRDRRRSPFGANLEYRDRMAATDIYDPGTSDNGPVAGGTSTIVYDTRTGSTESHFMSLAGTARNCAGGPTPWGSWLTCEETVDVAGENGCVRDHGCVFEVPATATPSLAKPLPIRDMGRFNHEAVCVDPASGCVYLTEDRGDGLLYRYVPNTPGELHRGGRLEALVVRGQRSCDTRNWESAAFKVNEEYNVDWRPLDDVNPRKDNLRFRGFDAGAARFARGEGIIWADDAAYIVCTNGGKLRKGQVWKYVPSKVEGTPSDTGQPGRLSLFVESHNPKALDMPDNIGVAPWGDLVLCEDGGGEQFVVGVTPSGELYKLARNAKDGTEFAGGCFSPDGSTLFINIQVHGLTVAITGPWRA
ncbi:MAG: alkaline phosphatase PhoX [Planctomycetota bacterium]